MDTTYPMGSENGASLILRRISWGAIFAGVVTFLVLQLFFGVLGLAIGAATIDPLQEQNPFQGVGVGTGIWFLLTTLVSFYISGLVAGRLSANPTKMDRALHGLIVWGLSTLLSFYLVTATAAGAIAGTIGVLGRGLGALSQAVPAMMGDEINSIRQEVADLVARINSNPNTAGTPETNIDVSGIVNRLFLSESGALTPEDRSAVVDVLTARAGMSQEDALALVGSWERRIRDARANGNQRMRETTDQIASGISRASIWTSLTMALGALFCSLGGLSGFTYTGSSPDRRTNYTPGQFQPSL